jgi:hypothetical protein
MLTFVLISLLVGLVLGHRFKVLVLLPAIAIAMLAMVVAQIAGADRWPTTLTAAAAVVVLQLGYLAGYGVRRLIAAARASRQRAFSVGRSQPKQRGAL